MKVKVVLLHMLSLTWFFGAFSGSTFADDFVEIGAGRLPAWYTVTVGLYNYSWSQAIYLQREIGSPLRITAISYPFTEASPAYVMNNQHIFLKHTTLAQFPSGVYDNPETTGFNQVYAGSVTWNGSGWGTITLDTPFEYNGVENLIVYWQNLLGSRANGYPRFWCNTLAYRSKYAYSDSSLPAGGSRGDSRPNLRLHVAMPWSPQPENGAPFVDTDAVPTLAWTNLGTAAYNALYFSTNQTWVTETNLAARVLSDGTTRFDRYTHSSPLEISQTYYWRVIETDAQGATIKGNVWSFSTVPQPSVIESFGSHGELVFKTPPTGATQHHYRVESSTSLESGAWASAWTVSGIGGATPVTNDVSTDPSALFVRVIATKNSADFVDGPYMVIDVAGGPSAVTYPVAYFATAADVPGGITNNLYKTSSVLMRLIPKGTFIMGSPEDEVGRWDDETEHAVTLTKDFYIGVYEVTQRQWERVMGAWPSYFSNAACRESRPVERVSYFDVRENPANSAISPNWPKSSQVHADSFMGKLRAKTGLTAFDLPTEAQWEFACRAGTTTELNSGKNLMDTTLCANVAKVGRYRHNGGSEYDLYQTTSVGGVATTGSFQPNAWGLYDMHGNVYEWCLDGWDYYPGDETDPVGSASTEYRLCRSGGWYSLPSDFRSANRPAMVAETRYSTIGFRLAMTQP